jgi:uncharacterized protein
MARAGFYAIQNSSIRFGRDGCWYADGQPIVNRRIAELFARSVHRGDDGTYWLRIGDERAPIAVDDTPYVVIAVGNDPHGEIWIELNDGSRETLDPGTLRVGADDVLYCRVKGGSEMARVLRPAYYQLAEHIAVGEAGRFILQTATGRYAIERR